MKKHHVGVVATAFLVVMSQSAQATLISVSAEAPGVLLPSLPLATVITFDDLPLGSLPSYQFSDGALWGSGVEEDTSLVGKFAQPAGDATDFLTVSYPSAVGAVYFAFTNPENYFGLYWGSMDSYNSIVFLENNEPIATYSGTDVAGLTGLVANGQQQSATSNRYVEFRFDAGVYDEVILSTTGYGFEVDNVAFGDPPSPIPEPGTVPVLVSSLYGLALARRRRFTSHSAIRPWRVGTLIGLDKDVIASLGSIASSPAHEQDFDGNRLFRRGGGLTTRFGGLSADVK